MLYDPNHQRALEQLFNVRMKTFGIINILKFGLQTKFNHLFRRECVVAKQNQISHRQQTWYTQINKKYNTCII